MVKNGWSFESDMYARLFRWINDSVKKQKSHVTHMLGNIRWNKIYDTEWMVEMNLFSTFRVLSCTSNNNR